MKRSNKLLKFEKWHEYFWPRSHLIQKLYINYEFKKKKLNDYIENQV